MKSNGTVKQLNNLIQQAIENPILVPNVQIQTDPGVVQEKVHTEILVDSSPTSFHHVVQNNVQNNHRIEWNADIFNAAFGIAQPIPNNNIVTNPGIFAVVEQKEPIPNNTTAKPVTNDEFKTLSESSESLGETKVESKSISIANEQKKVTWQEKTEKNKEKAGSSAKYQKIEDTRLETSHISRENGRKSGSRGSCTLF